MPASGIRIVIQLVQGEPEPKGELAVVGESECTFAGWIGLISALECAVSSQPARNAGADLSSAATKGDGG